jgi:hypothetical protein
VFEIIEEEEPTLSPVFNSIRTPQLQKRRSERLSGPAVQPKSVKLPKLVRMSGESEGRMKQDLKSNIKKMIN